MSAEAFSIDADAAENRLMRYLAVEGVTGQEAAIGALIVEELLALGVPADAIAYDDANTRIPVPTETGNLIVTLPGTKTGPRLLFSTHLDTVPLVAGAKPSRVGDRIVSDGTTALGGDNRTGCGVLVTMVETLLANAIPHPPLTLLFTVREESGLHGAREVDIARLGDPVMGFNVDGRLPSDLVIGAVGQETWEAEIHGKAAHAGVAPQKGVSSTLVGAIALAEAAAGGWFGKVVKDEGTGTSNIGIFGGKNGKAAGDATNVVTDYAFLRGEARSPDAAFAKTITAGFAAAFETAKAKVTSESGETATIDFRQSTTYPPFRLDEESPVVIHAKAAVEALGLTPNCRLSNGGLDANWLEKHGIPSVTIGAGQCEPHTVHEYVEVADYLTGCRLAVALASLA
ncbi:M20/M25/M40 family metallo-hydrolase [Acuticoccus sp. M5D2P5]|uniref:M20/M25/M40 family metallo-hydrolase n=1 Tax=Acuticoccus kalidii TaxID=2910977 RepID=UPI001F17676E|nr:M20/M25/M40 family metallo-hydrolase [Acuticoccus kalidii]MCF3932443.1 M20/M25/M40 family metallo-hydrolase [Acuticoccus kalidii]